MNRTVKNINFKNHSLNLNKFQEKAYFENYDGIELTFYEEDLDKEKPILRICSSLLVSGIEVNYLYNTDENTFKTIKIFDISTDTFVQYIDDCMDLSEYKKNLLKDLINFSYVYIYAEVPESIFTYFELQFNLLEGG